MNVVGHAAGLEGRCFEVAQDADDIGVEARTDFRGDQRFAEFGAENQMNQDLGEGLGHEGWRPFRADDGLRAEFPGRCPGLMS